jgi:glycolate oxidase FAD binding subunit
MDAGMSPQANQIATFEDTARAIVGGEHVRTAGADDVVAGVPPNIVVEPGSEEELAAALKTANDAGLAAIPRGGGTKVAWGNAPRRAEAVVSTARLNAIINHAWADLTVSVEAGCTIKQLRDTLAQQGQRLALDALWPSRATVGGVLSTNDSGALRLRFGALRDLIIGVTLALPDGTLASSGGRVVKNVAGYDLPKLVTGAFGTLGVITRAIFRLHPLPKESCTISCLASDVREAQRLVLAIQDSKLAHSALQVRFVASMQPQVDVLFEATQAGLAAQVEQLKAILTPNAVIDPGPMVWNARQELYTAGKDNPETAAVAKISTLAARCAAAIGVLASIAAAERVRCNAVMQATGIGCAHLEGTPDALRRALVSVRKELEREGGSLTIAHSPNMMPALDTWGEAGDALPLMRAVKQQFDPKATLNPGRYVGGI